MELKNSLHDFFFATVAYSIPTVYTSPPKTTHVVKARIYQYPPRYRGVLLV